MSTDITPIAAPIELGRDPQTGFFKPGNQIGLSGGNPNARKIAELNRAFLNCGTDEIVSELFELTLKQARDGDTVCLKYLLDKLTGRPIQAVEVSSVEPGTGKNEGVRLTQVFLSIIGDDPEKKAAFAAALRGEPTLLSEGADASSD